MAKGELDKAVVGLAAGIGGGAGVGMIAGPVGMLIGAAVMGALGFWAGRASYRADMQELEESRLQE